jgi:hypothetical protein
MAIRESMDDLFAMDDLHQMGTSMLAEVIHGSSVARHAGIMPIPVKAQCRRRQPLKAGATPI